MNVKYDRHDILMKGMHLIRERGYGNTGIQDILKACNIPKGSFYNFFPSKKAFALEAIDIYKNYTIGLLTEIDQNDQLNAGNKIKAFFKKSNELFTSEGCNRNCLLLSLSTEVTDQNDAFSAPIVDSFNEFKEFLMRWIETAQKEKEIRQDLTPYDLANVLYDTYHGAVIRMKYQQNSNSLDQFIESMPKLIS